MNGMSTSGKPISGLDHLRQSIADILTTPIGSRVMRRDYGSLLPGLIDQPQNNATTLRLYSAGNRASDSAASASSTSHRAKVNSPLKVRT